MAYLKALLVLSLLVLGACSSDPPTAGETCSAYDKFLDESASGVYSEVETRDLYKDMVHSKASKIDALQDASREVLRGYTYYVDGAVGADDVLRDGLSGLSAACREEGY